MAKEPLCKRLLGVITCFVIGKQRRPFLYTELRYICRSLFFILTTIQAYVTLEMIVNLVFFIYFSIFIAIREIYRTSYPLPNIIAYQRNNCPFWYICRIFDQWISNMTGQMPFWCFGGRNGYKMDKVVVMFAGYQCRLFTNYFLFWYE
jgi:hypothetical protein